MNDYEQMKNENKDVHKQMTEIQKEIDKTKNESQAINEKLNDLSNENQKLKNEIKNLDSKIADLTNENQKLRSQNGSFNIKIDNILNENHSYENEIQTLELNLRSVSNENQTLINDNQEIKRNIEKIDINTQSSITKINNALSNGKYAISIQYDKLKPFDGIINYFTQRKGGNVCDLGIINVTSKDYYSVYHPKYVVDLKSDSVFESKNTEDEWLCFDFGKNRIVPTSYTIKTYDDTIGWTSTEAVTGEWNLKSWVIEVSNNGNNWIEIDRHENNYDLNHPNAFKNFTVNKKVECQYFRLRQIGPNHKGYYYIVLKAFEIFGELNIHLFE